MDHRIPRVGVALAIVCAIAALLTFIFLNLAFEGPSLIRSVGDGPYEIEATFEDTEVLPTKQPVLLRGLEVGKVRAVDYNDDDATATVRFTVDDEYAPIYRDAKLIIGERTVLGDPFLNLDPGTEGAGEVPSGSELEGSPSVDFDEALDFLDAEGRAHAGGILGELRKATRDSRGAERLNSTAGELSRTVRELRALTDALRGQEDELAGLVGDGALVLDELGSREAALRSITSAGRVTLDALAANSQSLSDGLAETPPLLDAARRVLAESRPLLEEAAPLVRELRRAAPELSPILAELPGVTADTVDVVSGLAGVPTLRKLLEVVNLVAPAVPKIEAATRNLVTLMDFTADHADGIAAFFANMAGATAHGDSAGRWLRVAAVFEPGLIGDFQTPSLCRPEDDVAPNAGLCRNAYPQPGDAADNEPYEPGSYPRLEPYEP